MTKRFTILCLLILSVTVFAGCYTDHKPNEVLIQTKAGRPAGIIRAPGIWTITEWRDEYYPVDTSAQSTGEIVVATSTKDRASFKWPVKLIWRITDDNVHIWNHVVATHVDPQLRAQKINEQLTLRVQAVVANLSEKLDTTELVIQSDSVQRDALNALKEYFANTLWLKIEELQFIGKPNFDNDAIDLGPSKVIQAILDKQAEEEGLKADKIRTQRLQEQAKAFENPKQFQIQLIKERTEALKALSGVHTLVIGEEAAKLLLGTQN